MTALLEWIPVSTCDSCHQTRCAGVIFRVKGKRTCWLQLLSTECVEYCLVFVPLQPWGIVRTTIMDTVVLNMEWVFIHKRDNKQMVCHQIPWQKVSCVSYSYCIKTDFPLSSQIIVSCQIFSKQWSCSIISKQEERSLPIWWYFIKRSDWAIVD